MMVREKGHTILTGLAYAFWCSELCEVHGLPMMCEEAPDRHVGQFQIPPQIDFTDATSVASNQSPSRLVFSRAVNWFDNISRASSLGYSIDSARGAKRGVMYCWWVTVMVTVMMVSLFTLSLGKTLPTTMGIPGANPLSLSQVERFLLVRHPVGMDGQSSPKSAALGHGGTGSPRSVHLAYLGSVTVVVWAVVVAFLICRREALQRARRQCFIDALESRAAGVESVRGLKRVEKALTGVVSVSVELSQQPQVDPGVYHGRHAECVSLEREAKAARGTLRSKFAAIVKARESLRKMTTDEAKHELALTTVGRAILPEDAGDAGSPGMEVESILGGGGFGRVQLVRFARLRRAKFALKTLKEFSPYPAVLVDSTDTWEQGASEEETLRAAVEMVTLTRVTEHSNIVSVVDMDDGQPSMPILLEVANSNLYHVIGEGDCSPAGFIRLMRDCARGVEHLHKSGVVHTDLSPGNILVFGALASDMVGKISDFGLARATGEERPVFTGTPGFIPLENLRGTIAASPDQDVWSLAMVSLVVLLAERGYHHYLPCCKELMAEDELKEALELEADSEASQGRLSAFRSEVMARTLSDGSFERRFLKPEMLDDSVPDRDWVCRCMRLLLSSDPRCRPQTSEVAQMLEILADACAFETPPEQWEDSL